MGIGSFLCWYNTFIALIGISLGLGRWNFLDTSDREVQAVTEKCSHVSLISFLQFV